jgi:hypothetical protein
MKRVFNEEVVDLWRDKVRTCAGCDKGAATTQVPRPAGYTWIG